MWLQHGCGPWQWTYCTYVVWSEIYVSSPVMVHFESACCGFLNMLLFISLNYYFLNIQLFRLYQTVEKKLVLNKVSEFEGGKVKLVR